MGTLRFKTMKKTWRSVRPKAIVKQMIKIAKRSYPKAALTSGPWSDYNKTDPLPPHKFCKLIYGERYDFATGAGGTYATEQVMRLNSLYDPDFTGAGHQPRYFDQMAAMYRKYIVYGALIELTFTDPSADGIEVAALIQPSAESLSMTGKSVGYFNEMPQAVVRPLNNTGNQLTKIRQYLPLHILDGISKVRLMNDPNYSATTTDNPALSPWLRFSVGSYSGTSGVTVRAQLKITYYCKLYDRILVAQS